MLVLLAFLSSILCSTVICLVVTLRTLEFKIKKSLDEVEKKSMDCDLKILSETQSIKKFCDKQIQGVWSVLEAAEIVTEKGFSSSSRKNQESSQNIKLKV